MPVPPDIDEADVEQATAHAVTGSSGDELFTPEEHQTLKNILNGDELQRIKNHTRRYLVVGAGDDESDPSTPPAAKRRQLVYDRLGNRTSPSAVSMQLEDFGLQSDSLALWWRLFDILCGRASHIVAVIEDFDGGYTWELGLLADSENRQKTWVLKRRYEDEETEREKYDNGMAASHLVFLERTPHCQYWRTERELKRCVDNIP